MLTYQNIASMTLSEMVESNVCFATAISTINTLHCENNLSYDDITVVKYFLINHLDTLDYLADKVYEQYKRGLVDYERLEYYEKQIDAIESLLK